jgi:hypothetical protein
MRRYSLLPVVFAIVWLAAGPACAAKSAAPTAAKELDPVEKFDSAVAMYQNEKFDDAAAVFSRLAASGFETPTVYFNLGNCWVKTRHIGRALWAYERAFLLDPRDEDIRFNLGLLRASLGEPPAPEVSPLLDPVKQMLKPVRTEEISTAVTIASLFLALWMLGFAYIRSWRAVFGTLFWLTMMGSLLVGGAAWVRWDEVRFPAGVVQEKEVFVRYGPAESNSKAYPLKEGASVRIEKQSGDWYLVRLANGQSGWIPKTAVLRVTP